MNEGLGSYLNYILNTAIDNLSGICYSSESSESLWFCTMYFKSILGERDKKRDRRSVDEGAGKHGFGAGGERGRD